MNKQEDQLPLIMVETFLGHVVRLHLDCNRPKCFLCIHIPWPGILLITFPLVSAVIFGQDQ